MFCKHACKRLFIRLLSVFGYSLIRYSYQTIKYTCMDVVSVPFFVAVASVPGRQVASLNIWNGCA
nr:MAG TPA: hypothetical protein [Caudoviricetes sp.]